MCLSYHNKACSFGGLLWRGLLVLLFMPYASANILAPVLPPSLAPFAPSPYSDSHPEQLVEPQLQQRVLAFEAERLETQRNVFLEAEQALANRQWERYRTLAQGLEDYPLYPYLQLDYFSRRLGKAEAAELERFLVQYADTPVAGILRYRILRRASHRHDWATLLRFYQPQTNVALQCQYLRALINTGRSNEAYPHVEALWLHGRSRPKACDPIFDAWRQAGKLTPVLVWQRLELAIANRQHQLVHYLARQLPKRDRRAALLWQRLYGKPKQLLKKYKQLPNKHEKYHAILVSVLNRLAKRHPQEAADFWLDKGKWLALDQGEQYGLYRTIAISLARRHLPGAEAWFSIVPTSHQTEQSRLWRIRSALRESQWQTVLTAIETLPQREQEDQRWTYWRARAMEQLGQETEALAVFGELALHRSYYGFLAADRLGLPYSLNMQEHSSTLADLFTTSQDPGIKRASEFFQLDRITDARREWHHASAGMDDTQRSHAAKLAQLWGWYDQSIHTMAHTTYRDDLALRFPLLFKDKVMDYSRQRQIETAWTYAIIRRESAFTPDIRSPAGAIGLMQLMPATARGISRRNGIKYRGAQQLVSPDTNLALGTTHLAKMLDRFGQQKVLATAAYNAGAARIRRWLPEEEIVEADRWIETIPIEETREYVSGVLAYTIIYYHRLGQDQKRLSQLMPQVASWDRLQTQGILTAKRENNGGDV
jgi:soluble lytic murein transglycosylase